MSRKPYLGRLARRLPGPRVRGAAPEADQATSLETVATVWEAQARADPLWAVLSDPDKRGRRWDLASFMATGEEEVGKALARWSELGGTFPDHSLAVDFGSGVGRLTQPLGRRFDRAVGVDISPTMVAVARRLNQAGDRVEYVLNRQPDLRFMADQSASLVYSHITLQHLPPEAAAAYVGEFLRVAKPGGGIIFQLPSHLSEAYLPSDRSDTPVPPEARQAEVRVVEGPERALAGQEVKFEVEVTNASTQTWTQSAENPLSVGNYWVDPAGGGMPSNDDARGRLPGRLHPGEVVRVELRSRAPARAGEYELRVDVVQELVAWFGASTPGGKVKIDVVGEEPDLGAQAGPGVGGYSGGSFDDLLSESGRQAPPFAMNAIPRPEVEELLGRHGARILGADEWVTEWHSFMYYVQAGS